MSETVELWFMKFTDIWGDDEEHDGGERGQGEREDDEDLLEDAATVPVRPPAPRMNSGNEPVHSTIRFLLYR